MSDTDYPVEEAAALAKLQSASTIIDQFANGAANASVTTESGETPTLLGLAAKIADKVMLLGNAYTTQAAGEAATASGALFTVVSDDPSVFASLYLRTDAGSTLVTNYPSASRVEQITQVIQPSASTTWALRLRDSVRRIGGGWDINGVFRVPKMLIPAIATIDDSPSTPIVDRLMPGSDVTPQATRTTSQWVFALRDRANRIKLGVPVSGPLLATVTNAVQANQVADGSIVPSSLNSDFSKSITTGNYVPEIAGVTPDRKLYVNNLLTGKRTLISANDAHDPFVLGGSAIGYTDTMGLLYQPLDGGAPYPVFPSSQLTLFGDSMTASLVGVSSVGTLLGIAAVNNGVSGQGSSDIALRQGGLLVQVTVDGNIIPASGAVTVTAITPKTGWRVNAAYSFGGTLGGIPGTLARDASNNWTFTRMSDGVATACPAATTFFSNEAAPAQNDVQSLWMGRNNVNDDDFQERTLSNIRACIAYLKPYNKRYVVISVTNGVTELNTSTNYSKIVALNKAMAEEFGAYYYDLRADFIANGLAVAGITPTAADLANIAADAPPPSLMIASDIHPNATGFAAEATLFAHWLTNKGYFA